MQPHDTAYRRRWWTLAVLSLSLIVISLDNTVLNVALPSLRADLGASGTDLQWIVDSYMLVFAGLLLTAGALGDRFGRRRALTGGLVVFGVGSGLAALAQDPAALIASRALMGVGAAFIMPSTLSILTHVFPREERAKAIGIWAALAGLGIAIGPVAGGWLLEHGDWHLVFVVNLPFVVGALTAGRFLVPESRDPGQARLDPLGAVLSTAALSTLLYAIIDAPQRGWTDPLVLTALGVATALGALFIWWERRAAQPMIDLSLLRNPRFSGASSAIALLFFALFGFMFLVTQYLQSVLGYDALEAGVRMLPVAAGLVIASGLSSKLQHVLGTKALVSGGLVVVAAAMVWLSGADAQTGFGALGSAIALLGFGIGMAMAPATDSVMGSVPADHASVGSAVNDATRLVGGALGVAVLGSLLAGDYRDGMQETVQALPAPAADAASGSIGGALEIASRLGGSTGQVLH
ncbi:MAG TPA: MFS transporter, partial [Solirubrobacteraceae bacterium]|nr:MFS transporter [Solirubrobacteraceae bacterium]